MDDNDYMSRALELAQKAAQMGETPVGAVIVKDSAIIAEGFNTREKDLNPFGHAEIMAIESASKALKSWRLLNCTLYVTLEPCLMCAGAILHARIPKVIFGARDLKSGAVESLYQTLTDSRLNHRCHVISGVMADECGQILSQFFKNLRSNKN